MKVVFVWMMLFITSSYLNAQEGVNHYLSFPDSKALHQFYRYSAGMNGFVIQGHRGTVENNLPESSIAGFEYVLRQIPAIFEIDPRLTKDSVIIVFHDATLERTSNGTGKVIDHTWKELQELRLKNSKGELTEYKIHSLAEVLDWAKGKTALVLDKKDVPLQMIANIIRKHNANSYVMNMVRSPEDALFYYRDEPERMFSVSIREPNVLQQYMDAGIPTAQMFACVGTEISEGTKGICELLRSHGIKSLLATASSYDKLPTPELRAEAYRKATESGISIIESDFPLALSKALMKN